MVDYIIFHRDQLCTLYFIYSRFFFCKQTYRKFKQVLNFQCIYVYMHTGLSSMQITKKRLFYVQYLIDVSLCRYRCWSCLQLYQLLLFTRINIVKRLWKMKYDYIFFFLVRKIENPLKNFWLLVSYCWNCRVKLFYKRIIPVRFVLE